MHVDCWSILKIDECRSNSIGTTVQRVESFRGVLAQTSTGPALIDQITEQYQARAESKLQGG